MSDRSHDQVPWRFASRRMSIPLEGDEYWNSFGRAKFEVNNYFAYYRQGYRPADELSTFENALRDPASILFHHGRRFRRIRGLWENIYLTAPPRRPRGRVPFGRIRHDPQPSTSGRFGATTLQAVFEHNKIPFRVLKLLGAGGNGVAVLCDNHDPGNGDTTRKRFVVKVDILGRPVMGDEKAYMKALKRAPHIAQMLSFKDVAPTSSKETAQNFDKDDAFQLLEFCKHGDLFSVLAKDLDHPMGIKQVLKIFACLIKGCIAMQYPPRRLRARNGNLLHGEEVGADIPEIIPPEHLRDGCAYDLVHFDLDPQNVLLGDLDNNKHQFMPICKIADFGASKRTTSHTLVDPVQAMWHRRQGKADHPLPEQFHKEWEFVDILPQTQTPRPKVAGQYGPASNVFAIGLCMHSVITGATPPDPLEPFGPFNNDNIEMVEQIPVRYRTIYDLHGKAVETFYTYGVTLLEDAYHISTAINSLLIRCMADQPAHRPSLEELEGWIQVFESMEGHNDPDDYYESAFGQPPGAPEDIMAAFPKFRIFAVHNDNKYSQRVTERLPAAEPMARGTTWVGPPRAASAPARVDLEMIPADGRVASDGGYISAQDEFGETWSAASIWSGPSGPKRDGKDVGSSGKSQDSLGAEGKGDSTNDVAPSSSRQAASGDDDSSESDLPLPEQQSASRDDTSGTNERSSSRLISSQGNSDQGRIAQTGSEQGLSKGKGLDQGSARIEPEKEAQNQRISSRSESGQGAKPSSSGLSNWMSGVLSRSDLGYSDRSAGTDMDRFTVSSDGVGDMSSDEDDDHDHSDAAVVAQETTLAADTTTGINSRQPSLSPAAIARGQHAAQALRAARRARSGPSRLARVLARLRIRPLPPAPPARAPPATREVRRAARSSRFGLPRLLRPAPTPSPAPASGPATRSRPRSRIDGQGRLQERRSPLLSNQQRSRSNQPGSSQTKRQGTAPSSTVNQPHRRLRHTGRLPNRRSPRLGSQQGIPYPNAIAGQVQGIPVVPTDNNAARYPSYIPVGGGPNLVTQVEVAGPNVAEGDMPPNGDPRLLARAFAGEAAMDPSLGIADTIWHAPSFEMNPFPGYFRMHWANLLGVQRLIYFYHIDSEGANAVLGTRLQPS